MKKTIAIILCISMLFTFSACGKKSEETVAQTEEIETAENVTAYFGTLKPISEIKVIPSGKGQIINCPYEIGDYVNAGDLLYQIDDNGLTDTIATTKNSIAKANISISTAQENVNNLKIYAPASGILHNFNIKTGERVNATKIADIYDESSVVAVIPFNESQKNKITIGDAAAVTSADLMSSVNGKVTRIYDEKSTIVEGSILYNVEITIANPGGLHNGLSVSARIQNANGTFTSPTSGTIQNSDSVSVVSRGSGNAKAVYVKDGQKVTKGQLLVELENSSITSALSRANLDKSDLNIKLASLEKSYADLFVYAPASGLITSKSKKNLDYITSNNESIMIISDTSTLMMTVNVDQDILTKIAEGMEVKVDLSNEVVDSVMGTVHEINKTGNISGSEKTYPATIYIKNVYGISSGAVSSVDFGGEIE